MAFPFVVVPVLMLLYLSYGDVFPSTPEWVSNPLVGEDGSLYACYGTNMLAFNSNSTLAWSLPLGFSCRTHVSPVFDSLGYIYVIAENRVLKVMPSKIFTPEPAIQILFGPGSSFEVSEEIIGLCVSIWSSVVYINVKKRAIFALSLEGKLIWSVGPMLYRLGYPQGCKHNTTDCYFSSALAIDQCEGNLYVSNNEGQLYSMYTRSPDFRWIRDLSYVDKVFLVTPGNDGHLYVTFPRTSVLMSLDVSTGTILWQNNIGPLSSEVLSPVVDSNGWVSIGSLDGYLYSFSPTGMPMKFLKATATNSIIQVGPVLDCSGFAVYVSQTRMEHKNSQAFSEHNYISATKPREAVFTLLVPATGAIYWTGTYPGDEVSSITSDLQNFRLDEKILLALLASSGINKFSPSYTTRQKLEWTCSQAEAKYVEVYTGSEKTMLLFVLFQFAVITILAFSVRFCCVFWRKKKLQEQNLSRFIKKRSSLHAKRKACNRMISELEEKAATTSEVLDQLGNAVRKKEAIERKLSTTYSLGRDQTSASKSNQKALLPLLHDGKTKSYYSFHSTNKESVTIFNTLSDASTSERETQTETTSSSGSSTEEKPSVSSAIKGKAAVEEDSSCSDSEFSMQLNPLYTECGEPSSLQSPKRMKLVRRTITSTN